MDLTRKKDREKNFRTGCGKTITEKVLIYPKHKIGTSSIFD